MGNPQEAAGAAAPSKGKSAEALPSKATADALIPESSSPSSSSGAAGPSNQLDHLLDPQNPPDEPLPSYEDSTTIAPEPPAPSTTPPPPPFSIYKPTTHKHYLNSHLITHDPHLNVDGESLYRFILEENANPPIQHVQIQGTHQVHTTVHERDSQGRSTTRTETRSETDFHFRIDLTPGLLGERIVDAAGNVEQEGGSLRVFGDAEKIYRGGWRKTSYSPPRAKKQGRCGRHRCGRSRTSAPIPESTGLLSPDPTTHIDDPELGLAAPAPYSNHNNSKPDSALSIREWADRYCRCPTTLKEFIVYKNVTHLDKPLLTDLLTNAIRETGYRGTVHITFPKQAHKIAIYPNTTFARLRNNPWVRWFFYLTFLWIFSWPILFLFTRKFHVVVSEWRWGVPDADDGANERAWTAWWGRAVMYAAKGRRRDDRCLVEADRVSAEERDRMGDSVVSSSCTGGIMSGLFGHGGFLGGTRTGAGEAGIFSNWSVRFGGNRDRWGGDECC